MPLFPPTRDELESMAEQQEKAARNAPPPSQLQKCPACSNEVSKQAAFCPKCGQPFRDAVSEEKSRKNWGCGTLLAILIAGSALMNMCSKTDTPTSKLVVSEPKKEEVNVVIQVHHYLRDNLKDPDSLQIIEWSDEVKSPAGLPHKYSIRCKYRARNSFGGYAVENQVFYLDAKGNIIDVRNHN